MLCRLICEKQNVYFMKIITSQAIYITVNARVQISSFAICLPLINALNKVAAIFIAIKY